MNTIDERCYGYEPAQTQLNTLRTKNLILIRENDELRTQVNRLTMEKDLVDAEIGTVAEIRDIIFDDYPRSQSGMIGSPAEVLACALHWMKKTRDELAWVRMDSVRVDVLIRWLSTKFKRSFRSAELMGAYPCHVATKWAKEMTLDRLETILERRATRKEKP